MKLRIRRWFNFVEHHVDHGHANAAPLRKVAVAAVVENPYAGQQVEDLRLHGYCRPVTKQLATLGIKRLIIKGKLHVASPGPRPLSRNNQACLTDKSSAGQSLQVAVPAS